MAEKHAELVVLGGGPGGYTAAFRAADLGRKVTLIERSPTLGGTCLNVGCIPSKALLHVARVIAEAEELGAHGVCFNRPAIDLAKLRHFKGTVVGGLTGGLKALARSRGVEVVQGAGIFTGPDRIELNGAAGIEAVTFEQCIVAAGSEPVDLPFLPNGDPRVIDSTGALELTDIPQRMLVIGGGIIGLEIACVYAALGSAITIVELTDQIIPGADRDIVKPLHDRISARYERILLKTKVAAVEPLETGLRVTFQDEAGGESQEIFDKVLVAVGRKPNGARIGAKAAGVTVDERGFIPVDSQCRTNVPHIFAVGDVVGQPMLAHKATHEGKVAAEAACGLPRHFDARVIPAVAYTDPEVAWVGLTETQARAQGVKVKKAVFPWLASGRALSLDRSEGLTKLLVDPGTEQVIGAAIVGLGAGELIASLAFAIEMGATAGDLGQTIFPHPTLSETVNFAAEIIEGTITDMLSPRKNSVARVAE